MSVVHDSAIFDLERPLIAINTKASADVFPQANGDRHRTIEAFIEMGVADTVMEDLNRCEGQVVQFRVGTYLLNDQLSQLRVAGSFWENEWCMVHMVETKTKFVPRFSAPRRRLKSQVAEAIQDTFCTLSTHLNQLWAWFANRSPIRRACCRQSSRSQLALAIGAWGKQSGS